MSNRQELVLEDFKTVRISDEVTYLSVMLADGKYEVTIEPHLVSGYCVGIYRAKENLAIEKKATWALNHPAGHVPQGIELRMIDRALFLANLLIEKHLV